MSAASEPSSVPQPQPSAKPERMAAFDALRYLTCLAIVFEHTPKADAWKWTSSIGHFALHFFIAASVFFVFEGVRRKPGEPYGRYALRRLQRIYVPFLLWTLIYWIWANAKTYASQRDFVALDVVSLINGTGFHLWFLPYLLVASLLSFALAKALVGRRSWGVPAMVIFALAGVGLAMTPAPPLSNASKPDYLLQQGVQTLPTLCWAVAFSLAYQVTGAGFWRRRGVAWAAFALTAIMVTLAHTLPGAPIRRLGIEFSGTLWLIFCLGPHEATSLRKLAPLGALAYGVYLLHPMVLDVWLYSFKFGGIAFNLPQILAVWLATCAVCTLLVWLLRRLPGGEWLVP